MERGVIAFAGDLCYTVQRGDWLWAIARKRVGSFTVDLCPPTTTRAVKQRAADLYAANRAAIGRDPNRLRVGTVLVVGGWTDVVPLAPGGVNPDCWLL